MSENLKTIHPFEGATLGRGSNASVEFGMHRGVEVCRKKYTLQDPEFPVPGIMAAYSEYRKQVGEIYPVPQFYELIETENGFVAIEQIVKGPGVHQIIARGNLGEIADVAEAVFLPLSQALIDPITFPQGSGEYYINHSPFPVKTPIDTKPDNYIVDIDRGELDYIDFQPPRLRDVNGMVYPKVADSRELSRITHLYGDLTVQIPRFFTRCAVDYGVRSDDFKRSLFSICREVTMKCDPSGKLLKAIWDNIQHDFVKRHSYFRHGPLHTEVHSLLTEYMKI